MYVCMYVYVYIYIYIYIHIHHRVLRLLPNKHALEWATPSIALSRVTFTYTGD